MTENTLYALNQVRQCHITPEELEISQTKIILYTKHFRKELNASSNLTRTMPISRKGKMIYLADQFLGVEYDTKNPIVITDGSTRDTNRNHCTARGWITRDTFLPHMQRTTLKSECKLEKFYPIPLKFCHALWKS